MRACVCASDGRVGDDERGRKEANKTRVLSSSPLENLERLRFSFCIKTPLVLFAIM